MSTNRLLHLTWTKRTKRIDRECTSWSVAFTRNRPSFMSKWSSMARDFASTASSLSFKAISAAGAMMFRQPGSTRSASPAGLGRKPGDSMTTQPSLARDQLLRPCVPENTTIKLIGLGGVGSIVARYLTTFLASLGGPARLVFIDGD